jgi:hypothetical protein
LRWRAGNNFIAGEWNLGNHYKWMGLVAMAEIVIMCIYFIMPFEPAAVPGNENFTWIAVNYAPILVGITLLILWVWWRLSVRKWFKGPIRTI